MKDLDPDMCASLLVRINPYDALHLATDASRHATSTQNKMFWADVIAILKSNQVSPSTLITRSRGRAPIARMNGGGGISG